MPENKPIKALTHQVLPQSFLLAQRLPLLIIYHYGENFLKHHYHWR